MNARTGICCGLAMTMLLGALAMGNPFLTAVPAPPQPAIDPAPSRPAPLVEPTPRVPAPAIGAVPQPAGGEVGACPMPELEEQVVRRGHDQDGWPTWWLGDGRVVKEVVQKARDADGTVHEVPATMLFRPLAAEHDSESPR